MSQGSVKKPFRVQSEWSEDQAIAMDALLGDLVNRQTVKKTGTYSGMGVEKTVEVAELPNPPILLILQKNDGSAPHITLMPLATSANVKAWNKTSFTLASGSSFNAVGSTYLYLVIA